MAYLGGGGTGRCPPPFGLNGDAENARHEIAGHENAAPECKGGKCETWKCEKRGCMEHRVLHMSVHCRAGMHESTRKSTRFRHQLCSCERLTPDKQLEHWLYFIIRFYSAYICHLEIKNNTQNVTPALKNWFRHWFNAKHNTAFLYNIGRAGRK